jgi:hypothetical protein
MIAYANVVVYSYQYMLDPKVAQMVCPPLPVTHKILLYTCCLFEQLELKI